MEGRLSQTLLRMQHRKPLIVLIAVILSAGFFAAGAFTAIARGWGSPLVRVTVHNESEGEVRSLVLDISSCGKRDSLILPTLGARRTHTFQFPVCGEGGYQLVAIGSDGKSLKSEAYVESGYSVDEYISTAGFRSSTKAFRI